MAGGNIALDTASSVNSVRWYAVHTRPETGSEDRAKINLERQGYITFYPYEYKLVTRNKRNFEVKRPYFPRYLFVGVYPELSVYSVNYTFGVSTIVKRGHAPFEIPQRVVDKLKSISIGDGLMLEPKKPETPLHEVGEMVKILRGPFEGFLAEISRVDGNGELGIYLDLFGRRTPSTVPVTAVSAPASIAGTAVAVAGGLDEAAKIKELRAQA